MPRHPFVSMAGLNRLVFLLKPEDYKDAEELKSCQSEFHRILQCGFLNLMHIYQRSPFALHPCLHC